MWETMVGLFVKDLFEICQLNEKFDTDDLNFVSFFQAEKNWNR